MSTPRARRHGLVAGALCTLSLCSPPAVADSSPEAEHDALGLHLGLRTGFGVPYGRYADVRSLAGNRDTDVNALSDDTYGVIPLWVDAGYWVDPHLMLGVYFMYGLVLPKTAPDTDPLGGGCPEGLDCSASGVRFGVQAWYRFAPGQGQSPWLGLGLGYEWINSRIEGELLSFPFEAKATHSGPDLLQLQGGIDFQLDRSFALGPFAAASALQYTSCTLTLSGTEQECEIEEGSWHGWLVLGVRGTLEL